jgi:hypothetical protein
MDEIRFRTLMHEAIGDEPMQPWLATAVRGGDRLRGSVWNPTSCDGAVDSASHDCVRATNAISSARRRLVDTTAATGPPGHA